MNITILKYSHRLVSEAKRALEEQRMRKVDKNNQYLPPLVSPKKARQNGSERNWNRVG